MPILWNPPPASAAPVEGYDDDDVYSILQHGKVFHNLVYMPYIKHINSAFKT
jgi:hypothetical protein